MTGRTCAMLLARLHTEFTTALLIVVASCLLLSTPSLAAVSFVQTNNAVPQTPQTTVTVPFNAAQSAGNLNMVAVGWLDTTSSVLSVTDTRGHTYVRAVGPTTHGVAGTQSIYYAADIADSAAGTNSVTVTFDAAVQYPDIRIAEYSGIDPTNPLDVIAAGTGNSGMSSSGAVTTTNANDLLVGANYVASSTADAGAGFTGRVITNPDGSILQDRIVTATGSYSSTAPLNTAHGWIMQMAAFRAAGAGDTQAPTAPSALSATAVSSTQINLSWTASTDDVGVVSYLIERCQGSGCSNFAQIATASGTAFNSATLEASTTYSYRVRATDAAGNQSGYSNTASETTPSAGDTQAPTASSALSATAVSSTQINLSWTASTDDVGVTNYLVERCEGSGCSNFVQIATTTATSYSDTGRSPSTSYSYRVRASDAASNYSTYSTSPSTTTPALVQSSLQIESLRFRLEQVVPVPDTPLTYDVTARAAISNSGTDAVGATARIIGAGPAATVFDGNVGFGDVPPIAPLDAVRSLDTFKLRIVITAPDDLEHAMQSAQSLIEGLSWQISCADCGGVRAPIANAGPDQSVFENQTVTLDGSASTDPDGHLLQFSWSLLSAPAGAQPQVANASSVRPTIVLPVPGIYVVKLVVNDGSVSSAPATVTLNVWNTVTFNTGNSAPVANAGADQTAPVGTTVELAGGASTDVNGDRITYEWELIETPANSSTALANADPATPVADFVPDAAGRYVAQLVVHDAVSSSAPDTTIISTTDSAPVANAGTDVRGQVGQAVPLNGSASWDPDGNAVSYQWSLVAAPAGSIATLSSTSESSTTLTPDVPGTYVAQLVVDDGIAQSEPDTVVVSTANSRPVAAFSAAPTIGPNHIVTVDASSSFDPDGDAISFSWAIISTPVGSTTGLESNGGPTTQFVADVAGTYVLQVWVSDGALEAPPATAQIVGDFVPPSPAVVSLITVTLTPDGRLIVRGAAGSVEPNTFVRIRNATSGDWITVIADANGAFEAVIFGQVGDELMLRVEDQSHNEQAEQQIDNTGQILQVIIDRRWQSETVIGRHFVVNGRIVGPLDAGVSVNGTVATIVGTGAVRDFYARVPVTAGANTVTAVAQRVAGAQATDSIVVSGAETPTFSVEAAPQNGLAPLDVEFTIQKYVRDRISRIEIDFDGDFVTDLTQLTPKTRFQHRYEQPGVYWARFLITTEPTQTYEIHIPVAVFATSDVDSQVQTVWQLFTGALAAGDRATALQYMTTSAAQQYESVFTQLQTQMPAIIASFSVAEPIDVLTGTAEYIVRRAIGATEQAFFIYFVRAPDGTWRIASM